MNNQHHAIERIDPLTSCGNLLFFLETSTNRLSSPTPSTFSMLLVDLNRFAVFNTVHGHKKGDELLRWISIVLRDTQRPVFRIGGDEMIVIFPEGRKDEKEALAREIADIWTAIGNALDDAKINAGRGFVVHTYNHDTSGSNYQMRVVVNTLTERLISFANRLDETNQLAYLDPTTQLPNNLAAERELEDAIQHAKTTNGQFTILFIDGDNLRLYNDISYSAGDDMIRYLGSTLSHHLRPGDFLARWRVGDEFFIILPDTPCEKALMVAERLRSAVETEFKAWQIPVSVSIGIADYPARGTSSVELLNAAEQAEKQAKDNGKNQAVYL